MKPQTVYKCFELNSLKPQHITTVPTDWKPKERFFLNFLGSYWYQVRRVEVNHKQMLHVHKMFIDGEYLKSAGIVYACNAREKRKWQDEALLAIGHTKKEITAALCLARMKGDGNVPKM